MAMTMGTTTVGAAMVDMEVRPCRSLSFAVPCAAALGPGALHILLSSHASQDVAVSKDLECRRHADCKMLMEQCLGSHSSSHANAPVVLTPC